MLHCMRPIYESVPLSYSIYFYIYSLSLSIYIIIYLYMLDMLYGGFRHGLVRFLPFVLDSPLSVTSPKGFAKETSRLRVKLITVGAMSYLSGWLESGSRQREALLLDQPLHLLLVRPALDAVAEAMLTVLVGNPLVPRRPEHRPAS